MKQFKIRCSAIGQIMTEPRSKSETLGKTCKTYLEGWVKEQLYGRQKDVTTKYMQKGLIMEDNAIDILAEHLDMGLLIKNEKHFEDEYMTGTPDVLTNNLLADVKSSWDCFTFPLFDKDVPNTDYYWQAQGYMYLTGKTEYKLAYILCDTPINLIEKEMYYYDKDNGTESDLQEWIDKMTYGNIQKELKVKIFDIKRNDDDMDRIITRVLECRNYVNELVNGLNK